MNQMQLWVGTSGWSYNHWKGVLYPKGIQPADYLNFYARSYRTVEVNTSFYGLPAESTLRNWKQAVLDDFVFAVKTPREVTHNARLKDEGEVMRTFLNRMELLGRNLGPVLVQLPPGFKSDPVVLKGFLDSLPEGYDFAFEFRHPSWFDEHIYDLLRSKGAALCIHDYNRKVTPRILTGGFTYLRLHGAIKAYQGRYSDPVLQIWARFVVDCLQEGLSVYCYFDNTQTNDAPFDALRLAEMAAGEARRPAKQTAK